LGAPDGGGAGPDGNRRTVTRDFTADDGVRRETDTVSTPEPRPAGRPGTDPTLPPLGDDRPSPPPATTSPGTAQKPPAAAPAPAKPTRHTGRTIGRTVALTLLLFVTVVLVLFVVFNTQTVDISLVFTDVRAPLVLALVIAAVLGGLVAALLGAVMAARGRRRNR
jgi:uncharacterized integral membrane protein